MEIARQSAELWKGDLVQGVISCADGFFAGACSGCVIRQVNLEVDGSDEIGSLVQAKDGDCFFEGARDSKGFTATAISGCNPALVSLDFALREENLAGVYYWYDINKVQVEPGEVACITSPSAQVRR